MKHDVILLARCCSEDVTEYVRCDGNASNKVKRGTSTKSFERGCTLSFAAMRKALALRGELNS
jgi:hypothetical protein